MFDVLKSLIGASPSGINGTWTAYDNAIVFASLALIMVLFVLIIDKIFTFFETIFHK